MAKSDTDKHYAWLGKLIAEDRNSKESTCDLVLESEGKEFLVHKNIMMLVSKYFKKMFTVEMKEKYEGIVKMLQIPHQRLANLIEFIYSGRIEITVDNVTGILDDAEYTELEALKEICKSTLLKLVSADNCLKLRAYAQRYNLDEVFVKTNQEITTSFAEVVRHDDFMQINVDDISGVIKLRNKTCEEAVFTGIVQWVNHNPLLREKMFANLFLQLELSQMGYDFMTAASKENLVRSNLICSNFLVDNLLKHYRPTPNSDLYKFLVIGGKKFLTNCVAYDVNTKQATKLSKLNTGRMRATSVKVGSKVCVFGGAGEGKVYKSCEMLDFVEQTKWKVMPDMLKARQDFSSCSFEDHIYVTGGYNNYKRLSSCERFSSNNNTWSRIKDMIHTRDEHGTVVCDRYLYCIGGSGDNKTLSSCERYDVRSDVWNEIAPLNQARHGLVTVVLNKEIYAIGGLDDEGQYLSSVERLNPEIGKWEIIASLQHARYYSSACVVGNKIYVIGGSYGKEKLNSVEVYDPALHAWTVTFETKEPVYKASVVAI